jgi:hypothetical protein
MRTQVGNARGTDRPLHVWVLAAVLLYEVLLSVAFPLAAWRRRAPDRPLTLTGERLVVLGDGLGYYAWLRSLVIDGDWDFDNEFDGHNPHGDSVPIGQTSAGRRGNPFSIGPALVWAPAVALTHLGLQLGLGSSWPADGYSLPYQVAVGISAVLVAAATLALLFDLCRRYARPGHAALAAALLVLGSTLLNYGSIEVSMAHGCGTLATALLVWYWLRTYGSARAVRWAAVGALVGAAALMRWQLAALAVLPAGEAALDAWKRRAPGPQLAQLALAGLASLVAFFPQMLAWKLVYGHWLVSPMPLAHNWWQPEWARVLVGTDRSLFYWTPLTLLPLLGCVLCQVPVIRQRITVFGSREPLALLLAAFVGQVYLLASISGDGVILGSAFGHRQLTEAVVLLAPGLALLLEAVPSRWRPSVLVGCFLLAVWNTLLLAQYHLDILPKDLGASPAAIARGLLGLLRARPAGAVLFVSGPLLVMGLWLWRQARAGVEEGEPLFIPGLRRGAWLRLGQRPRTGKVRRGRGDKKTAAPAQTSLSP